MNTIIFVSNSTWGYGADYSMISILNFLKIKGIKPYVIIPGMGRTSELLKNNNIEFLCIPFKCCVNKNNWLGLKSILKYIINKFWLRKTLKVLKKNTNNIVGIYNNVYTNYFSIMLAKAMKVPHIQHIREFGGKDFGWKYDKFANKLVNKYSKKIICISDAVKNSFLPVFDKEKMIRIYNGINTIELIEKEKIKEPIKIAMVGRLSNEKNQITLIKATETIINKNMNSNTFFIDIFGDGEDKDFLQNYVKEKKLEKFIHFNGYKYQIDLSDYQIGIMCSKAEGFGRVTVEYMMNEMAVIASNTGANPEIVESGYTGELFEYGNYIDLSKKIIELLNNPDKIIKYGKNGRHRALEKFNEDIYVENIYEICKECFKI